MYDLCARSALREDVNFDVCANDHTDRENDAEQHEAERHAILQQQTFGFHAGGEAGSGPQNAVIAAR